MFSNKSINLFMKSSTESLEIKKCNNRKRSENIDPLMNILKSFLSLSTKYNIMISNKKIGIIVNLLIPSRNIPKPVTKH